MDIPQTPMLRQYESIKSKHKDCILFFRLGDFYEMFYEDAQIGSRVLDLVLTSRGKDPSGKIPMCGIPYHSAENYIAKLIKSRLKVAICEQVEDPSVAKGIVKRDVIRIITSGTYLDENSNDSRYLLCLTPNATNVGIAFTDPTSGTIQTNQFPFEQNRLVELITKLPVLECIYPQSSDEKIKNIFNHPLLRLKNIVLSPFEDWCFNTDIAKKTLCDHFGIHNLNGFGIEGSSYAVASSGALLEYLKQMNKQPLRHIDKVSLYSDDEFVYISPAAHKGLEIETLIKTLDHTITALGKRKLNFWFYHPLKNPSLIRERQEAVTLLKDQPKILEKIKFIFNQIPDVEKNISRLSCGLTHAKDLLAIRNTLKLLPEIKEAVTSLSKQNPLFECDDIKDLREYLLKTINEEIPLSAPEGKVICNGVSDALDELRNIQQTSKKWLQEYQAREIKRSGINSLKVGFTNVFGYYIEITRSNLDAVPADYIRKQTLVNAERFITPELKEFEEKILTAEEKILRIENEIIKEVQKHILDHSISLHNFCQTIATLDCLYSLTVLANKTNYICPEITLETLVDIKDGRHPVVEEQIGERFVSNDTFLDSEENHLIILTGPNMAGKSTYIRQTAILVMMAQMGSFIPASKAHVGIVDKIFTRIGAHDDILKGQSTFMVEMNETADILNNLTDKSLIILDEIGRGTSTYDGLSLAWALAEYLQKIKARTLFATHLHELTALADKHHGIKNYNVAVKEWKDEIIFMHKIIPGSTDDSYGIYVAKLAGVPPTVIHRAKQILTHLEMKNDLKENLKNNSGESQLNLFAQSNPIAERIKSEIESLDVNTLTPLQALNKLQELKEMTTKDA